VDSNRGCCLPISCGDGVEFVSKFDLFEFKDDQTSLIKFDRHVDGR